MSTKTTHDHDEPSKNQYVGDMCCTHHEIEVSENWILLYLIGGVLVLATVLADTFNLVHEDIAVLPAVLGTIVLSANLFVAAFKELKRGKPTSSTLAALAILAAVTVGKFTTAGFLAFILLVADQVVRRTANGAQRAIEQLIRLTPDNARIVENGTERDAKIKDVVVGMSVRVRPGENLPVDGRVTAGNSTINQASLTGESVPIEVSQGDDVFAGTTNLTGQIDLMVTRVGADTTIGKVSELIREAESARTPRQMLIQQVAAYFVPVALSVAGLVLFFMSSSPDEATKDNAILTAITVLIVVCPSALLLASPTAMVAAFASAARLGILIKTTNTLEAAANIDTVVFDKTGTLTTGIFAVSRLVPSQGVEGADLLQAAADGEQHSNHPLAKSIMTTARAARITPHESQEFEESHGLGVRASTAAGKVHVGRANWLLDVNQSIKPLVDEVEAKLEGMTGVHVMRDGTYLGAVGLEDKLRSNARNVVDRLREVGARTVAIFTGDRAAVAHRVAQTVGIDMVEAECLPEEKYAKLGELLAKDRHVLMVGDGINDGPSLASADVGVAMGLSGSDIATNSAGVALMNDDLSRIPFLIDLARKTRTIVAQNIAAAILIAIIGLVLAATGSLTIFFAAFYHFLGDLFVFGNSFRLIRFGEEFAAHDHTAAAQVSDSRPEPKSAESFPSTPPASLASTST
jgi:Zn2+/Cd2+-exporting ATPase